MEDEENWDIISLSSFNPTLCLTVMPFIRLYTNYKWGYYYIILFTILVRCSLITMGSNFFSPVEKN